MQNFGAYLAGTAFWLFLGACAIAGIVADYKRRRLGMEVLRAAIEKGQQLDPVLIDKLTSSPQERSAGLEPMYLKLGGIITIAAGIGLYPLGYLVGKVYAPAYYPILGLGVLAICVGVGLLVAARVLARAEQHERISSPSQ
jgi:hypothetical protein